MYYYSGEGGEGKAGGKEGGREGGEGREERCAVEPLISTLQSSYYQGAHISRVEMYS